MLKKIWFEIHDELKAILNILGIIFILIYGAKLIITIYLDSSITLSNVLSVIFSAIILYITVSNNNKTSKLQEDITQITKDYNERTIELQKNIADQQFKLLTQQNNIALFDKRYNLYIFLIQLKGVISSVYEENFDEILLNDLSKKYENPNNYFSYFKACIILSCDKPKQYLMLTTSEPSSNVIGDIALEFITKLHELEYVFKLSKNDTEDIGIIVSRVATLSNILSKDTSEYVLCYLKIVADIVNKTSLYENLKLQLLLYKD